MLFRSAVLDSNSDPDGVDFPVPGNEKFVYKNIDLIMQSGAKVIYNRLADVHVRGHAAREELKIIHRLVRPKYFVPLHGEYRQLFRHAALAHQVGSVSGEILLVEDGQAIEFTDEGLRELILSYTREAGVRNLEREISSVCRKVARKVVVDGPETFETITSEKVTEYLGVPRYRPSAAEEQNEIGVATGLAWTEVGGELLVTETTLMPGRGKLTLTGKLGDVMQESAQAAMSWVRSKSEELGIPRDFNRRMDVHIHIPEGAIPKDGPSAGITLATSLVSALTRIPVRSDLAMTGEVTLRGTPHEPHGFVADFAKVERACLRLRKQLDHKLLNEIKYLGQPSLEHLAIWVWHSLADKLPGLARVTVCRESLGQACSYSGPSAKSSQ